MGRGQDKENLEGYRALVAGGDMHTNRDIYGPYEECLQCGHMVYLESDNGLLSLPLSKGQKKKVA